MLVLRKRRQPDAIQTVLAGYKVNVSFKINDSVRYGGGDWDKIPFSIGLSVDIPTHGSDEIPYLTCKLAEARELLFQSMQESIIASRKRIRDELCAEKFV